MIKKVDLIKERILKINTKIESVKNFNRPNINISI